MTRKSRYSQLYDGQFTLGSYSEKSLRFFKESSVSDRDTSGLNKNGLLTLVVDFRRCCSHIIDADGFPGVDKELALIDHDNSSH